MSETAVISLFDRIGGASAIDRLVESFYQRMDALPEAKVIRAMHPDDLARTKDILKRYLSEWTGGPRLYSVERGHPRLRQRHFGVAIGEAERDAWLLCMRGALNETVKDAAARQELDIAMSRLADWMRNQIDNPHDAAHGGCGGHCGGGGAQH
ncbi:MAG: group II truncated hemoglobin [Bradyrhizobium sp.]|uniref:group II truncated hemoglobin n=1 Tax=Bradyrhizobium sp. TaxID=376 RepID=UPI0025BC5250|nr:group II truncated hemoglobin [Bradyrhizobium sp.]MBI5260941.1 group II truncated hemoglobin [Bradyrhizobium sp.]